MKTRFISLALLFTMAVAANAQRTGVREEVLADWNKCSGLDCLYDLSPKASTPAPKGYEAVYVSHYGRHGSRYAYTDKAYTVFLNMLADARRQGNLTPYGEDLLTRLMPFWDNVRDRVGDLTPLGWKQHAEIARTMVKSFPSAFGKGSVVDACASASARAIVSMSSFCASVSREAPAATVYAHQSVTDVQATRPNMGENPLRYVGPAAAFPYSERSEDFMRRRFPQYHDVLARLFKDPGKGLGMNNPYDAFFNIYMFIGGMNSLPEDVRVDVSGIVTPEEYAMLWEIDNYERFCEYRPYRTSCASIIDDMVLKADAALAGGRRGADLRFGHDHVVMSLLMLMDIDGFDIVPSNPDDLVYYFQTFRSCMAANIQYVFFAPKKGKGDVLVKVLLNGEEVRLGELETVSGPFYRWEDVKNYLAARTALYVTRPEEQGWTSTEVSPGLVYRKFSGTDSVSGTAQRVFVADLDLSAPGYKFKYVQTIPYATVAEVMKQEGAIVAMNAAYEPTSIVLKIDGELYSNMPNNTIMGTGIPNWKSEAALYSDGSNGVSIAWEGKGRSLEELRALFASSTVPNIYTSAPMLIDDYVPVGETFAGFYRDSAIKNFNYEDARNHQAVRHPRTAVALTADNHLLMIIVDGRRPGESAGMSARELTRFIAKNFNPRWAINMDGGGSTTLCVQGQGDPNTNIVNRPTSNKSKGAYERRLVSHFVIVRE
ncbi:MAG: phosphodiester glycosidase family protein [Bacteroidales bacterium]|nr:phosphodiester glycosidase family protein [Bacteroidales bacterium]